MKQQYPCFKKTAVKKLLPVKSSTWSCWLVSIRQVFGNYKTQSSFENMCPSPDTIVPVSWLA